MTLTGSEQAGNGDRDHLEVDNQSAVLPRRRPRRNRLTVKRALMGLVAALVLASGLVGITPVAASAAPQVCDPALQPYGLIGARWAQLGGANSALGCPTTGELDVFRKNVWVGRLQRFVSGEIAWSPNQGKSMVVAAWARGSYAYFSWGPTDPFHYDKFLVRWDSAAGRGVQREVGGGTSGQIRVLRETTGGYRFVVEGCDSGVFGSQCGQGWTIGVRTY